MIYGASLAPLVKKAFSAKAFHTNVNKIIEQLPIDPGVSNMDAVVLGPKDLGGATGRILSGALERKHPSIVVVYIFQKDKEADLAPASIKRIKVGRVNLDTVSEAVTKVLEVSNIGEDRREMKSSDALIPERPNSQVKADELVRTAGEIGLLTLDAPTETVPAFVEGVELPVPEETSLEPIGTSLEKAAEEYSTKVVPVEKRIEESMQYADWDFFKKSLEKDKILQEVLRENTEYAGVANMLEVLDRKIANVFQDPSLTAEARFEAITQLGMDRAAAKGVGNGIIVNKMISIMHAVANSATATVENRINGIRIALDKVSGTKQMYADRENLHQLINERLTIQAELLELARNIIETYKAMDASVGEIIRATDEGLPSNNAYINEMLKPVKDKFTPQNAAALATKLMKDLQENRIVMSALEKKIQEVIELVFKLCETDSEIIEYQQNLVQLLEAQRVEDVVIVDTIIKNSLRIFVGPKDTGRTATALTWCGTLSRRNNSILIDLSGSSKFSDYGVDPVSLDDFMAERIEREFLCVVGNIDHDLDRVDELVNELKMRLNYYPYVNIILDSTQHELLEKLGESALTVHYITDCTPRGLKGLKETINRHNAVNIARKVVLIDPPMDPIRILKDLNIDPLLVKLIIIPRLSYIMAASLKGLRPYESKEVREVFEEAFR